MTSHTWGIMSNLNLGIPFSNRINPTDDNVVNPFNPTTQIAYSLKSDGMTTLDVYNVLGQKVLTAVSEFQAAGSYRVTVDCSRLSSGTFIYTRGFQSSQKHDGAEIAVRKLKSCCSLSAMFLSRASTGADKLVGVLSEKQCPGLSSTPGLSG